MEKAPENNNRENLDKLDKPYEEERNAGYSRAEQMIKEIDGFEKMDYREQFGVLSELLQSITENENRFEADFIAAHMYHIEHEMEKEKIDEDLEAVRKHYKIAA